MIYTGDLKFTAYPSVLKSVLQQELPGRWLLEGAYVGNRGYDLTVTGGVAFNAVPQQYLSTSPERDQATIDLLILNVRQQLLRPHQQFTGIARLGIWRLRYISLRAVQSEKRFAQGYTILMSYTISDNRERVSSQRAGQGDRNLRG